MLWGLSCIAGCNKESDSIFDGWPVTTFKPHHSSLPFCLMSEQALRELGCSFPWLQQGSSNQSNRDLWMGILTLASLPDYNKNPHHFLTGLGTCPAFSKQFHYVSNKPFHTLLVCVCWVLVHVCVHVCACVYMCGITLNIWTKIST